MNFSLLEWVFLSLLSAVFLASEQVLIGRTIS